MLPNCFKLLFKQFIFIDILYWLACFQDIWKLLSILLQQTLHKIWAVSAGHSCWNIHDNQERDTYKTTGNVFNTFYWVSVFVFTSKMSFLQITDHFFYVTVAGSHRLALLLVSHGPVSGIGLCAERSTALSIPSSCCLSRDAPLALGPGSGLDHPGLWGRTRR